MRIEFNEARNRATLTRGWLRRRRATVHRYKGFGVWVYDRTGRDVEGWILEELVNAADKVHRQDLALARVRASDLEWQPVSKLPEAHLLERQS